MIEPWFRRAIAILALGLPGTAVACASPRLDPNNHAFTFYPPAPSAPASSAAPVPSVAPTIARSESSHATKPGTAPARDAAPTAPDAASKSRSQACSILPDPTPTRTDRWVDIKLQFDRGAIALLSATEQRTRRLELTPRKLGRFMLELWIGCELIDRVRFDFPLLAGAPPKDGAREPNFEAAAHFETTVRVPNSDRATRLELIDRSNPTRQRFDWPLRIAPSDGIGSHPLANGDRELSPKR